MFQNMYFFKVIFFVLSRVDHFLLLDRSIYHVMTATQNNDSTIGRWKTEPKQETLFLARNCRGCKLFPPAQTNKLRKSEENKSCFFVRSSPAFVSKYFYPYPQSLDHKLVQKVRVILFYVCMQQLLFKLHSCFTVLSLRKPTPNRRVYVVLGNFSDC